MKTHRTYDSKYGNLLWMSNGNIEVAAALDYGLRIVILQCDGSENMLYRQPDDLSDGLTTEKGWRLYGGHRFWVSPESDASYYPDNEPIGYTVQNECVLLTQKTDPWTGFKKQFRLSFCNNEKLMIEHILTNCNRHSVKAAVWGITTLKGGGVAKIPYTGKDGGYSPNRSLSLWFNTSLEDTRLSFEEDSIVGRHIPYENKLKIGAYAPGGKIFFENNLRRLEISFTPHPMNKYPDNGSNVELFLNKHFTELETLGVSRKLAPGETVNHAEYWRICKTVFQNR